MSTSGGAGSDLITVRTHLTGAAIATLFSAPTTIVAAPGAGKTLWVTEVYAEFLMGVVSYQIAAGALYYSGGVPVDARRASDKVLDVLGPGDADASSVRFGYGAGTLRSRNIVENRSLRAAESPSDPNRVGPLVTVTVNAGGAGYVVNDTGTLDGAEYIGDATYRVSAVGGGGAVTAFVLTDPGDGYANGGIGLDTTAAGAQPGVGAGFKYNITNVAPADGDLYITTVYAVVSLH